ncbi:hypothetical protein [Nocardioides sp. GXZ039]|uniref:hypothetical protein n=1 Tax=Nocardioides sp. GXZ039 TaxID=3136018 RepID=UPI0030F3D5A3
MRDPQTTIRTLVVALVTVVVALIGVVVALVVAVVSDDPPDAARERPGDQPTSRADDRIVEVRSASVGQCIDVSESTNTITMMSTDCSDLHDAEISYVGFYSDVRSLDVIPSDPDDYTDAGASALICTALMDSEAVAALDVHVMHQLITQDDSPSDGDSILCYVSSDDGIPFTEKQLP